MKKIIKILAIVLLVLILVVIATPFLFKGKIVTKVKEELNKNLNAKVEFKDFGISLIRSFPDLSINLDSLTIIGKDEFEGDTLIAFKSFKANLNLISAIKAENIKVNKIFLESPKIYAVILPNGKANWDISKDTTKTKEPEKKDTIASNFKLTLKEFTIKDAIIIYDDQQGKMLAGIKNLNYTMSGDMTADFTSLKNNATIETFTLVYDGVKYINQATIKLLADIDADLKNFKFTFNKNELKFNEIPIKFDGWVSMPANDIEIDLKFAALRTDFKDVLSLIPAIYMKDFKDVQTAGTFTLNGYAKGIYNDKAMPGFGINLAVDNASFKYPSLPKSAENINLNVNINSPGGLDTLYNVDVSKFNMKFAENPFDAKLKVQYTPKDIDLKGKINGIIDLTSVSDVIPVQDLTIKGIITTNNEFEGKLSAIEKGKYDEFKASGSLKLADFFFKNKDFPIGVDIKEASFNFSPKFAEMTSFHAKVGKSDFQMNGKLENHLAYIFKDKLLKGNLNISSNLLDVNELMSMSGGEQAAQTSDTSALKAIELPKNIDFTLTSNLQKVLYDKLDITNLTGIITLKDGIASFNDVKLNALNGTIGIKGSYDSKEIKEPKVAMKLDLAGIDINAAAKTFNTVKKLAPIAESCLGKFSLNMDFTSTLDKTMTPVYETFNGFGNFSSNDIKISNSKMFTLLADKLKSEKLRQPTLKNVKFNFKIKNGNIEIEKFPVNIGNANASIEGKQSLDKKMDFNIDLKVPKNDLGTIGASAADELAKAAGINIASDGNLNFDIGIGGEATSPKITRFNLKTAGGSTVQDAVKDKVKEEAEKLRNEAEQKAKEEADKLKKEAEKKVDEVKKDLNKKAEDEIKKKLKKLW